MLAPSLYMQMCMRHHRVMLKGPSLTKCRYSRKDKYTNTDSPHVKIVTCTSTCISRVLG